MVEDQEKRPLDELYSQIDTWVSTLSNTGTVEEIDSALLQTVFESLGAEFDVSPEAQGSLAKYTNKGKADGMRAVWGDNFKDYKEWTKRYIGEYEADPNNRELPALKDSGKKNSGMIQFFGELTSFASGQMTFDEFKTYTEARVHNGRCWAEDRKGDRLRVQVPTKDSPILLSSVPQDFPSTAWEHIKGWNEAE